MLRVLTSCVVLLWCLVGCGAPERVVEPAAPIEPSASPPEVAEPARAGTGTAALDALPWSERIGLEQAMAASDARYLPHMDETGPVLPGSVQATITQSGAHLEVGAGVTFVTSAVGRAESLRALVTDASPTISGAEVRTDRGGGVVEWWRSLPSGLEHGVTIAERPAGEGELLVEVAVSGELSARSVSDDAVALHDAGGELVAMYAHLVVLDANGARVSARMGVRDGRIAFAVDDADARYPVVIDPLLVGLEEATLLASGGAAGDQFGWSVALTSDGSRALVGAYLDDTAGGADAGSARVFLRTGTGWAEEATLLASGGASNDDFGWSVALTSDGSRALVGAPGDDTAGGADAGSARVFLRTGTGWAEEATLRALGGAAGDNFGSSVALTSDGSRALVGAPSDDTAGGTAGSARVFLRTGTGWAEEATLLASGGAAEDYFGISVALTSDGSRALVGAPFDDTAGGADAGSARVFLRTGRFWAEEATLLASGGAAGDNFGSSVALTSDGSRALVGAPGDDTAGGPNAGSARVFLRTGTGWAEEATLLASGGASDDGFGQSVALTSDGSRALVGAWLDDTPGGPNAGSARVFLRTGTGWAEEATLLASGVAANDLFGISVALTSDGSRALVGAWRDDTAGGNDAGSARVFLRIGTGWAEEATLLASGGAANDLFGWSVALTSDGSRALVGAYQDNTAGGTDAGSVRVFTFRPADPNGTTCTSAATCLSGFCVDSVCCESACTGMGMGVGADDCQACSAALTGETSGICAPLSATVAPTITCRISGAAMLGGSSCDSAEVCSPGSNVCPADALAPATTVCRPAMRACDAPETCTGTSAECPADTWAAARVVCRPSAGACDAVEACDGASFDCPADSRMPLGLSCRPPVGLCDAVEACDGVSAACPTDALLAAAVMCRASSGDICDAPDFCTGASAECLPTFLAGVECRASTGGCDPAELCGGASTTCPPNQTSPAGTVCRMTTDIACDPQESCDGASASCPTDETTCVMLDAGNRDAATPDAGATPPPPATGCACTVASSNSRGSLLGLGLLALALGVRRRRSPG